MDYREIMKLGMLLTINKIPHKTLYCAYGIQIAIFGKEGNYLDGAILRPDQNGLLITYRFKDYSLYETAQEIFEGWNEKYWKLPDYLGLNEC